MLKMGFIGQGGITGAHYPGYKKLIADGKVSIEAVADIRPEMLNKYDAPHKYGDYKELIEAEVGKLDFVDICLPTFLHPDAAIRSMEAGFNVIVEKPMALSYEECVRMCETAKRTGKTLMVAQCCRFEAFADAARWYLESGEFGDLKTLCFKRDGGTPRWAWENWFLKEELSGGAILDLHVHDVDLMNSLLGMPKCLSAGASRIIEGDGPDIISSNYYYENGLFTHITADWTTGNNQCYGRVYRMDFMKGHILQASFLGQKVFAAFPAEGGRIDLDERFPHVDMYYEEIKYFTECIAKGEPVSRCLPETTAESIRIALSEKKSASLDGERIYL